MYWNLSSPKTRPELELRSSAAFPIVYREKDPKSHADLGKPPWRAASEPRTPQSGAVGLVQLTGATNWGVRKETIGR